MGKDLTALTDAELEAEISEVQDMNAEANARYKETIRPMLHERDRRNLAAQIKRIADGFPRQVIEVPVSIPRRSQVRIPGT